jgi:peptidoglycan/xylan/chitin deacetylase (PgdA/CDA1 family)
MPLTLPPGKRMAVALTFDFDAHSNWMGALGRTSPSYLSRGDFGAEEGVPRILATLGERQLPATWAIPGHDLVTFPARVGQVMAAGHEICAHGCFHENIPSLAEGEERRLLEISLRQHEQVTGIRPRGFRSPSWDFSDVTMDLLEEFGFDWDSSLMGREFELYRPRRVEVNFESASVFGAPAKFVEIPVSWYLDDWPAVEYVPGVSPLGTHNDMIDRWKTIFNFAYTRVPGAVYTLTMHPQTIGRSHHLLGLEQLLDQMAGHADIWYTTLSELADAWHD